MDKVRENTLYSRKTNKIEEFKQRQVVFVSNKVVQPNKEMKYLNYYKPTISKKKEQKENFIVKAKIIDECFSIIIPPSSGGIVSKKLEVYFSKIIPHTPSEN